MSFSTTYWFVSCLATTIYLCWLCHSPLPDKEDCFVFLFTVAFLSTTVWVFSLAIPYDMHLMILTHLSFFWVVCHLNRTSPPKESEREPQNRLSLPPTPKSYPLLPLTHDLPLCIGWVVLHFCVCQKLIHCSYIFHGLEVHLCILSLIHDLL